MTANNATNQSSNRRPHNDSRKEILFIQSFHGSKMKFSKASAPTQKKRSMSIRLASFLKKPKFCLLSNPFSLIIVNKLNRPNNLIMIILNKFFGSNQWLIIKPWIRDASNAFHKILSQTMNQTLNILGLPKVFHILQPRFYQLPTINRGVFFISP